VDKFADAVNDMRQKWRDLFGEEPDLIHSVKVW
jgi:hypothetical protein